MAYAPEVVLDCFPEDALLPKKETGAERFINKFPEYDGTGVLIAVFDSGVDPAAPGLQELPGGERKLLDLLDCSGSGDVDTSVTRTVQNGFILGLTGRQLKIPEHWNNPSGVFNVGVKNGYHLYPSRLKSTLQSKMKERHWSPAHNISLADATQRLCEFEKDCPSPATCSQRFAHDDYKAAIEVLNSLEKKYKYPGPVYDCVVFHDGEDWCACIDTTESGNLDNCKLLRPFRTSGDFSRFGDDDMLSYSVNIYEEGNLLSIVTNCSSHGTHVASIAAGYHKDAPAYNGIAPGARVISMKIGDTKLDSMETGSAIMRALTAAVNNNVDVINMSYGEASKWSDAGRITEMINEVVNKHKIIFVTSAGNDGPALSTVGAPAASSDFVIGVGAYVSPEMMVAEYSTLEKMPGKQYTWSSTGPCADGALGVCVTAPGGAITSVPKWTLRNTQLMNGTSMSSPNTCGGVAVLMSALKAEGIQYAPVSIKRCLENTALKIEGCEVLSQGRGLLQVDKAFELMKTETRPWINDVTFKIQCENGSRGIYIREPYQFGQPSLRNVTIVPMFNKNCANDQKFSFDIRTCLVPSVSWITAPSHFALANAERTIGIRVNTAGLSEGVHFGEVSAYDYCQRNQGPLFRIPVTVVVPTREVPDKEFQKDFKPGERKRHFIAVPSGCTWMEVTLQSLDASLDARYLVHVLQLQKDSRFSENELREYVTLRPLNKSKLTIKVLGGYTLELCIARWWNNLGTSNLLYKIEFHGLMPNCKQIFLNGCEGLTRVDVTCQSMAEDVLPVATLTHYVLPLTPKDSKLRPLGARDLLPGGRQIYELVLTYNFTLSKEAEVTPLAPLFHDLLYESEYESQYWMIFDQNKKLIKAGDAFPVKYKYTAKLNGSMTLLFQLRHDVKDQLEKMRNMVLNISVKLNSPITLDCYAKRKDVYSANNRSKFSSRRLQPGMTCQVYITSLNDDKIPKAIKHGQYLTGNITFAKSDNGKRVDTYPLQYMVPPPKVSNNNSKVNGKPKDQAEVLKGYEDAMQDLMVAWIPKLDGHQKQQEVYDMLQDNVHAHNAYLNSIDSTKGQDKLQEIIKVSDKIIAMIDSNELALYYAMKTDLRDDAAKIKVEMDKKKNVLINALLKKGTAIADMIITTDRNSGDPTALLVESVESGIPTELDDVFQEFSKWADPTDSKTLAFVVRHSTARKQFGRALKATLKLQEDQSSTSKYDELSVQLAEGLGWYHAANYFKKLNLLRQPPSFQPF